MIHGHFPWPESHDLIEFCEARQPWISLLEALSYPSQITSLQYELLLQNVKKIVTVIATDCHNRKVKLFIDPEHIAVVTALTNHLLVRLGIVLQELWKPAEYALMRSDPSMLKE